MDGQDACLDKNWFNYALLYTRLWFFTRNHINYLVHLKRIWLLILSLNLSLVFAALAAIFYSGYFLLFGILFGIKFSVDYLLLRSISHWYKQKHLLWVYPLVQVFYPLFIVTSGLFGTFLSYEWKGRKY